MRFLLAIALCSVLGGWGWTMQGKGGASLVLSAGHRSIQRLIFDEMNFHKDSRWRPTEVSGDLKFANQTVRVLMTALPTQEKTQLNAISVEVDEDQGVDQRALVIVRAGTVEAQMLLKPPAPPALAQGELMINGKSAGMYYLFSHPFVTALNAGEGPLARRTEGGVEVSRQSQRLPLLVKLATEHAATMPALGQNEWAVWMPQENRWRIWGLWPEGWSL